MPKWNLRDDWPQQYRPRDKNNLLIDLFSMPFSGSIAENAYNTLSLDICTHDQKKLVIGTQSLQPVDILAITHGSVKSSGNTLTLTSHVFSVAWLNKILIERLKKAQQCVGAFPISWFKNWIEAGRVPSKIIYENVTGVKLSQVKAGEKIGTPAINQANPQQQQIKISIEYEDSKPGNLRFMHPRDFFSLLFWEEKCDPIFKKTPDQYKHPLLRKMMTTYEDGTAASLANEASQIINRDKDDWLGLRPPLRTYQRLKWEHIKEHLFILQQDKAGQTPSWHAIGSVKKRIWNPYLHIGDGYFGSTKCNIYVGEMLFRAGFRTIVCARYMGCSQGKMQNRLKYLPPTKLHSMFSTRTNAVIPGFIDYASPGPCSSSAKGTHELYTAFAQKVSKLSKESLNQDIQKNGAAYVFCPSIHVAIIDKVKSCSTTITIDGLHHWYSQFSRAKYYEPYGKHKDSVVVLRARPGGDPTEEWGVLDLNCLRKVK